MKSYSLFGAALLFLGGIGLHGASLQAADGDMKVAEAKGEARITPPNPSKQSSPLDHTVKNIDGEMVKLSDYRGKAVLIVNTASKCGFTHQYEGLQGLYDKYKDRGLVVLGFPSNDFGEQEPGTEAEVKTFCKVNYGVNFPLFAKVHAKGEGIAPLYKTLTEETPEGISGPIRWNFTKFLVNPEGEVVARFETKVAPLSESVTTAIEGVLPKK